MSKHLDKMVNSLLFNNIILSVIVLAGVLVGVESYHGFSLQHAGLLHVMDQFVLGIFVFEALAKMGAHGRKPWFYFKDPWNVFDFTVLALCLLPVGGTFAAVLRMARILRVLRLVTSLPKLQMLVGALLKSIPSMLYVSILLFLLFYVYAVSATAIFSDNDPYHFGSLERSMLSLFRVVTLEDWTDIMYIQMYGSDEYAVTGGEIFEEPRVPAARPVFSALFFVSFVLLGTMIVLNLFIGVIMNSMEEVRSEQNEQRTVEGGLHGSGALLDDIHNISNQLSNLKNQLDDLQRRMRVEGFNIK